jgi:GNAT superfamily N-acetyltransferase
MQIETISYEEKSLVVAALCAAFREYPVMKYVLKDAGTDYDLHLEALVGFFTEIRYGRGSHVLGIREGNQLAAAALLDRAVHRQWYSVHKHLEVAQRTIGKHAAERLERYESLSSGHEPSDPHYYLGMIGVRPEHLGKGYGGALLKKVYELSSADPQSRGISLSTETHQNVALYQHFGYNVHSEVDIDEVHSWCMYRPH